MNMQWWKSIVVALALTTGSAHALDTRMNRVTGTDPAASSTTNSRYGAVKNGEDNTLKHITHLETTISQMQFALRDLQQELAKIKASVPQM